MDELIVELKSIPFEDIIGNPTAAIIQGESQAARATADFIREVGFIPPDNDEFSEELGPVRMVFFTMERLNANGDKETVSIQVPLLSLVPIPAIQVKEAVIDFSVRIHEIEKVKGKVPVTSGSSSGVSAPVKFLAHRKHHLYGTVMKRRNPVTTPVDKNTKTETNVDMNVKITLGQADYPIGVQRLFDLLEQNITEKDG